jgi:hypothetical protein
MKYILIVLFVLLSVTSSFAGMTTVGGGGVACTANTCSLTDPADMTVGDADQAITCSCTDGSCVLTTNNSGYCTIVSGTDLHAVAASGTNGCIVYANNAPHAASCAASQVSQTVTIAVSSCNPSTDYVGGKTAASAYTGLAANQFVCFRATATCAGTLSYGYFHHYTTGETYKVCVYNDVSGSGNPTSSDTLVACSGGDTTSGAAGVIATSTELSASNTASSYFVCLTTDNVSQLQFYRDATGGPGGYIATLTSYASPPANLNGTWTAYASRLYEIYVTIK